MPEISNETGGIIGRPLSDVDLALDRIRNDKNLSCETYGEDIGAFVPAQDPLLTTCVAHRKFEPWICLRGIALGASGFEGVDRWAT